MCSGCPISANSVRPHPFIRILSCADFPFCPVRLARTMNASICFLSARDSFFFCLYRFAQFFPLFSRHPIDHFYCGEQCHTPPYRAFPLTLIRHKSYWSGRDPALWTDHSYFENVAHDLFRGCPCFSHSQHKKSGITSIIHISRYTVSGRFLSKKRKAVRQ